MATAVPKTVNDLTPSQAGEMLATLAGALADQKHLTGAARTRAMPHLLAQVMNHPAAAPFVRRYTGTSTSARHYQAAPVTMPIPPREVQSWLEEQGVDAEGFATAPAALLTALARWLQTLAARGGR